MGKYKSFPFHYVFNFFFFRLTPIQDTLITSNLMAIADKNKNHHNYSIGFDVNKVEKLALFQSQKHQILANAYNYGIELSNAQKKLIKSDKTNQMEVEQGHFIVEVLKKKFDSVKKSSSKSKVIKTSSKPLDKERWLPLRDRSYYKPKAKYLKSKSVSSKKISSSK